MKKIIYWFMMALLLGSCGQKKQADLPVIEVIGDFSLEDSQGTPSESHDSIYYYLKVVDMKGTPAGYIRIHRGILEDSLGRIGQP